MGQYQPFDQNFKRDHWVLSEPDAAPADILLLWVPYVGLKEALIWLDL